MGHLAAPPEERRGEVTGMVDEYVGKSSSGRRKNQLVSTEKSTSNAGKTSLLLFVISIILKKRHGS